MEATGIASGPNGQRSQASPHGFGAIAKKPTKRERELVKFLDTHGPATFNEIKEKSDIPAGTASTLLRKSRYIRKNEEGKWEALPM
jgi:hypothetical protein